MRRGVMSKPGDTLTLRDAKPEEHEALEALQHTVFDVLVTDLGLPRMSGEELARRARQAAPSLRVIFATGHEDYRSDLPGATLLVKPYDFKGVEDALRAVTSPAP